MLREVMPYISLTVSVLALTITLVKKHRRSRTDK